ncbi:hypothetical protein AB0F43_09265 [Kribbella sp. NPDC023972]|uniref:hypothetical protein n=1 Tax=Kribbella sp. NPDC023972 TaxID=3154795 RepID=UPI0033C57389
MNRVIGTTAAALLVAGSLLPGTAGTAVAATSANCVIGAGAVTAGGDHGEQGIIATVPPTIRSGILANGVYPDGLARVSSSMSIREDGFGGLAVNGYVILGDALYSTGYHAKDGQIDSIGPTATRIGGGWGSFVALEEAEYQGPTEAGISRWHTYGLRGDGVLFRWTIDSKGVWRNRVSAPGFAAVKSMALISKSRTYDTFLANTRSGALYTIHLPTTAPLQPIVKLVRRSTWQGFEALLAQKCGQSGTLLLGIDRDTQSGYLYAVSRANGLSTVIQSRGKVPLSFPTAIHFRWKDPGAPLNGE